MTQEDSSRSWQSEPLSAGNVLGQGCTSMGADTLSGLTGNDEQMTSKASPGEDIHGSHHGKTGETMNATPFFPVTGRVAFQPMTTLPQRGTWSLAPTAARLVSIVSLGAVLLWPLSSCGSADVPCSIPTADTTATPAPTATPITCTTSGGYHYLWIPSRGGWVPSDDGVHPNPGASGVGGDEGHSGVGGGEHGGEGGGHGGGEGG